MALVTGLLLILSWPAHAGGAPEATARRGAWAEWNVPANSASDVDYWKYWVWARRTSTAAVGGEITRVRLTRYACTVEGSIEECRVRVQVDKKIPSSSFAFDDTLNSAKVRFRAAGGKHRVAWKGTSDYGPAIHEAKCGSSPIDQQGRGLNRYGTAEGEVLGHRLDADDGELTFLSLVLNARPC